MDTLRQLARSLIARLPRGRAWAAGKLSRVLSEPFIDLVVPRALGVRMHLDPTDAFQLQMWVGACHPHVVEFLSRRVKAGSTVLCAGLHVGYFALLAARLSGPSGRVLAAEPDPRALLAARKNIALNAADRGARIDIFEGGLSDAAGLARLFHSATLGHSSFAAPHGGNDVLSVPVRRGDDWLAELGVRSIDLMVLDVEGWELHALRGLEQTIARSPSLAAIVEFSDWALADAGSSLDALAGFWTSRGYRAAPIGATGDWLIEPPARG